MNSAEIRVLEQMHHKRLGGFLERLDGLRLPAHGLAVGRHEGEGDFSDLRGALISGRRWRKTEEGEWEMEGGKEGGRGEGRGGRTDETGEGKFAQQEVGGALVAADFLQRERAGFVAVGFARAGERIAGCEEQLANGYGNTHATCGTEGRGFEGVRVSLAVRGEREGAYVGRRCLVAFLVRPFCCPLC